MEGADILLIQTALPWNSDADMQVLDSLGYSYDIVDMNSIGGVDLFSYPVVLIVNDQVQAFYDQYATQVTAFENYVSAGGILVFFAAGYGWAQGVLTADLPGGVHWNLSGNEDLARYNTIVDANHPIVTAQLSDGIALTDGDLYSNWCSHGWFSALPPDANVVLRESASEGGQPTLVDYTLGTGRVIASTLTWEHNWQQHTGGDGYGTFGRKALDDLFLYAFSGGSVVSKDLSIDLRVEDAPDGVRVRKTTGSYVEFVARIQGNQLYSPAVTLEVPGDMFGNPDKTYTRNRLDNDGYGQENQYNSPVAGQYEVSTVLEPRMVSGKQIYYKEIVWRFKVPTTLSPRSGIELTATASHPGVIFVNKSDTVEMDIIDWGQSILVTHRELLFSTHGTGSGWADVSDLLEQVYRSAAIVPGQVFYLDRYGINWKNTDNEGNANQIVENIDDKIEEFYNQLKAERNGVELAPDYVVIIGGDEVVPFYRMDDDDYGCNWIAELKENCEKDGWAKNYGSHGTLWNAYADNYFLSDNIYADIGGDQGNWEDGDLELAIGRIVGENARAMRSLMESSSFVTKDLSAAGLASVGGSDVDGMKKELESKGTTLYGLSNPDLTENDTWRRDDFLKVWEKSWQFFYFGGHGNPFGWYTGEKKKLAMEGMHPTDLKRGSIGDNHPLLLSGACNFAVPMSGGLTEHMVSTGMGGIVGSTGFSGYISLPALRSMAEQLDNSFVKELTGDGSHSERFGEALRQAKVKYNPLSGTGKKTMLEYVYYGLPWSYMKVPSSLQAAAQTDAEPEFVDVALSQPVALSPGQYSVILSSTVSSYTLSTYEGYDLLIVEGADVQADTDQPALPYKVYTYLLPPGSAVADVSLLSEHPVSLGQQDLPQLYPVTTYSSESGVAPFTGSGVYPEVRYSYQAVDFPDHTAVEVVLFLAEYDADTQGLTLFDSTDLEITFIPSEQVFVSELTFDKPEFLSNEPVAGQAKVQNITGDSVTLSGELALLNERGMEVGTVPISAFSVGAGAAHDLRLDWAAPLDHGQHTALLALDKDGELVAHAQESFQVVGGAVTAFDAPENARPGDYSTISLSFMNYGASPADVAAEIEVHSDGVEVGKLLQQHMTVASEAEGTIEWAWDPESLGLGTYTLKAIVQVGDQFYYAPQRTVRVAYYAPDFVASPTSGAAALTVVFTNTSQAGYTSVLWDFGDGSTSSIENPTHTYTSPGTFAVALTVSGPEATETETREDLIKVYSPVAADFTASTTSGPPPLTVSFVNLSTGDYLLCSWDFGDGESSRKCSDPSHTFTEPGDYTVFLSVSGPGGDAQAEHVDYISVHTMVYLPIIVR
jgi:PKD repeat protein